MPQAPGRWAGAGARRVAAGVRIRAHCSGRLELYSNRIMRRYPAWSDSMRARDASKTTDPNRYQQIIRPPLEMGRGLKILCLAFLLGA